MTPYICVIDDDPDIGRILGAILGYRVVTADGKAAAAKLSSDSPPLACFVDIHLADDDNGLDLVPTVLAQWPSTAIFVVTADMSDELVGEALAAGAHDFLQKPLGPAEVRARFRARIAEAKSRSIRDTVRVADLSFNYRLRRVVRDDKTAYLSPLGAELLQILAEAKSDWTSKATLKRRLWGGLAVTDNALDQRIRELRKALAEVESRAVVSSRYGKGLALHSSAKAAKSDAADSEGGESDSGASGASGF